MNTNMPQTPQELLEQIDADLQILVLVQGTLADGSKHYAYASIPPSRYEAFKTAERAGNYDLAEFGKVLEHGPGTPSAEVEQRMAAEYGANHRFEEELQNWMKQLNSGA